MGEKSHSVEEVQQVRDLVRPFFVLEGVGGGFSYLPHIGVVVLVT